MGFKSVVIHFSSSRTAQRSGWKNGPLVNTIFRRVRPSAGRLVWLTTFPV